MTDQKVPRVIPGIDLRSLQIDSKEAFLLSCLDGVLDVEGLVAVTGSPQEEVEATLARLEALGAVQWVEPPPPVSLRPPRLSNLPSMNAPNPNEQTDLSPERAKLIVEMHARIDVVSYYDLLGVPRDADRKTIRNAYFKLSKIFHPDSMYGKNLGSYKPKMEKIFTHLTKAYDVLGKKQMREEYDAYLKTRAETDTARSILEKADVEERADTEPPSEPEEEAKTSAPPSDAPDRKSDTKDRYRKFAAKRLLSAIGKSSKPPASSVSKSEKQTHAKELARSLVSSMTGKSAVRSGLGRAGQFMVGAREAERKGDLSAAMNAMRLAKSIAPDNADVTSEYERLRKLVSEKLVNDYIAQARYEERFKMYEAAANSWIKVTKAKPKDPSAFARAAECLLHAKGDLRQAQHLADRAVNLDPDNAQYRIVLAKVFMAEGLKRNAQKHIEDALKKDPTDAGLKDMLKQLKEDEGA